MLGDDVAMYHYYEPDPKWSPNVGDEANCLKCYLPSDHEIHSIGKNREQEDILARMERHRNGRNYTGGDDSADSSNRGDQASAGEEQSAAPGQQ